LDGCPNGFKLFTVAGLEALGPYVLPAFVDGQGNKDGYVCGNQLPPAPEIAGCNKGDPIRCELLTLGLPIYNFTDNDVPGQTA
jgi:hypothetical protein